jgi:general secretion pathway protein G
LLVIVIIGILAALLLPAIGSAVRKARETAVASEIGAMAQALNDFKSKYGDYPPSRIVLAENGDYSGNNPPMPHAPNPYLYTAGSDISITTLYQRSLRYMRKFFPRMNLSTAGPVANAFYDFNGNGTNDGSYVITGHECLVFFLGGVPSLSQDSNGNPVYAMTGFSRNPLNPFPSGGTGSNRQPALFEFAANRLVDGDHDGIPGYQDSLNTNKAYAYFSAYGGNAYDPNDDNFPAETDTLGNSPYTLNFQVGFPVTSGNLSVSPPPNPYTSSVTVPTTTLNVNTPVAYQTPQTFQIISAGVDGSYGVGGSYQPGQGTPLPLDPLFYSSPPGPYSSSDASQRTLERDNVCNFHNGRLD